MYYDILFKKNIIFFNLFFKNIIFFVNANWIYREKKICLFLCLLKIMNKNESDIQEELNDETLVPFYKRSSFIYLTIACLALIATAVAAVFYKNHPDLDNISNIADHDLHAGGYKAILLLDKGEKFMLSDVGKGEITKENGIRILENTGGELRYQMENFADDTIFNSSQLAMAYHVIKTPRGGQYKIVLSDGTKVWLNAASSLRYPDKFNTKVREVELEGEAYFEVNELDSIPFIVKSSSQKSQVTAGHFNISNYADDPVTTVTLLRGHLELSSLNKIQKASDDLTPERVWLEPGDEGWITATGLKLVKVRPDESISWKNGYFQFSNTDLKSVMREMSRWYDADVIYEGDIPDVKFNGEVRRDVSASSFLEMLAYLKVKFKIRKNDHGRNEILVRRQRNN
jgi:ferric-dicitrate binding protein FerR (iron transport regulator)